MEIEDLKNARLSETTQGYLAIYIQLGDVYEALSTVTGIEYDSRNVDAVNSNCYGAISNAQDEVMKLVAMSIKENICTLRQRDQI